MSLTADTLAKPIAGNGAMLAIPIEIALIVTRLFGSHAFMRCHPKPVVGQGLSLARR